MRTPYDGEICCGVRSVLRHVQELSTSLRMEFPGVYRIELPSSIIGHYFSYTVIDRRHVLMIHHGQLKVLM